MVLDGVDAVIIARSGEHRSPSCFMPMGIHLGARLPAFATSTGRVLLAQLDLQALECRLNLIKFFALTPHTLTDKADVRVEVAKAGNRGFVMRTRSTNSICMRWPYLYATRRAG